MFKRLFRNAIRNFVLQELLPAVTAETNARLKSDLEKAALEVALVVLKETLEKRL